jgi:hypothetical protein
MTTSKQRRNNMNNVYSISNGTGQQNSISSQPNPFTSLSSLNLNNLTISLDEYDNSHVKKYQVMEIEEDLLALSSAWYRLREETKQGKPYVSINKILDKELFNHVTEEDRNLASSIRDYYSKKIMMWRLKGQKLSKFREDMNTFIHNEGKVFKEDMCPLAYRLPEFYHYDIDFEQLANEHSKLIKERGFPVQSKTLKLKKTFMVNRRHSKRKEYWFSDQLDNLVTLSVTHDNPLLSLLDLHGQSPMTLTGKFNIRERDNTQYMVVDKYKFS